MEMVAVLTQQLVRVQTLLAADPANADLLSMQSQLQDGLASLNGLASGGADAAAGAGAGAGVGATASAAGAGASRPPPTHATTAPPTAASAPVSTTGLGAVGARVVVPTFPGARLAVGTVRSRADGDAAVVLLSHPTSQQQRACHQFRRGSCTRSPCRFSHGLTVPVADLKPLPGGFDAPLPEGSPCLARYTDGLWYPATVEHVGTAGRQGATYLVSYRDYPGAQTLPRRHVARCVDTRRAGSDADAAGAGHGEAAGLSSDTSDDSDGDDAGAPRLLGVGGVLGDMVGGFERHTRGIGSKLMRKMGYRNGEGLGRLSQGRAKPIEIEVLPAGRSLDFLRVDVTKRPSEARRAARQRKRARVRAAAAKAAAAALRGDSGRDDKFRHHRAAASSKKAASAVSTDARAMTTREANQAALQLDEGIRALQADVAALTRRHEYNTARGDHVTAGRLASRRSKVQSELRALEDKQQALTSSAQSVRRKGVAGHPPTKHLF